MGVRLAEQRRVASRRRRERARAEATAIMADVDRMEADEVSGDEQERWYWQCCETRARDRIQCGLKGGSNGATSLHIRGLL